jgi:toxin ParE1/3/4
VTVRVRRHPQVEQDIIDIAAWIARDSREVAWRFFDAAEETLTSLGHMPSKGSPKSFRDKRLVGIRTWRVNGFSKYLVFYQVRSDHVFVFAVLHGARRYRDILRARAD